MLIFLGFLKILRILAVPWFIYSLPVETGLSNGSGDFLFDTFR